MQTETPNSTRPSKFSPENRRFRRPRRQRKPERTDAKAEPAKRVVSCGGIIYRRRDGKVEIFFIKDPYQKWAFPKGKHQPGETFVETATREIREETGLDKLRYIAPVGKTSFRFRREEGVIHKVVFFFLFQASPDAKEKLMTREEYQEGKEPIFEAKWVPLEEAFSFSSYKNSDHLLAQAFRIIGKTSKGRRVS